MNDLVERVKTNMEELIDVREVDVIMSVGIDIEEYIQAIIC